MLRRGCDERLSWLWVKPAGHPLCTWAVACDPCKQYETFPLASSTPDRGPSPCAPRSNHGLAQQRCVPGRGPGTLLPDREHGTGSPADRRGEGRVPSLLSRREVPHVGLGLRPGGRCLGWTVRG